MTEPASSRRITSVRQLELLVEFMERHKDLALGRVHSKEARAVATRLWNECALLCNAEGTFRTPKEWGRYWNDFKGRVKSKLRAINQSVGGTGGGPASDVCLSPIEDRVAAILGRDVVRPLQGVQQNPFLFSNAVEVSHPQQPQEPLSCMENIGIECEHDMVVQILESENSVSEFPATEFPVCNHNEAPKDSAPQPSTSAAGSQPKHRSRRTERRPRRKSLLSQQVEESLDELRAAFVRLEEAKIAAQVKQMDIEAKKVEALQQIALAINRLADAMVSTFNPGSSTQQHAHHTRKRHRRISSSEESDH